MEPKRGLYKKYTVTKTETGDPVIGFFLLRPDRDAHARHALWAYAHSVRNENEKLHDEISHWLYQLENDIAEDISGEGMTETMLQNWVKATDLPPIVDVFHAAARNYFYVSFAKALSSHNIHKLWTLGFEVHVAHLKNRYSLMWTYMPDDDEIKERELWDDGDWLHSALG